MKKILLVLIIVIGYFIGSTLFHAGVFKTLKFHSKISNIQIYKNAAGTEDLVINREKGLLFISSSDRRASIAGDNPEDGIYLLDLNANPDKEPVKLITSYQGEFHPHGLSLLTRDGNDYLFVVNHNLKGNFIELFQFEDGMLKHLRSFEDEIMCCPNDLVAVDIDKFYVTNDHGVKKGFKRMMEDYLRIADASILYFDDTKFTTAYEDLNYANGINVSDNGSKIYFTETTGRKITVLNRDINTGELSLDFVKQLDTGLDNISIDSSGNLWIGAHPKLLQFIAHAGDSKKISASQVLKLTPNGKRDFDVEEIYLDNGEQLSASSTALFYKGELFIGVVFDNKLLRGILETQ